MIRQRIIAIIAAQALIDPADLRLDATPAEVGLDSLGLVESIFALEEAFDISIPFNPQNMGDGDQTGSDQVRGFDTSTIGAVVDAVEALVTA